MVRTVTSTIVFQTPTAKKRAKRFLNILRKAFSALFFKILEFIYSQIRFNYLRKADRLEYVKLKGYMEDKKMSDKELQELGQKLKDFYELGGYVNRWKALRFTALKGMAQGFGIFIGGTVVVGLVVWILGAFDRIPLVSKLVEALQRSVQPRKNRDFDLVLCQEEEKVALALNKTVV